jgi:single-strand DNA-binding protein
MARTRTDTTPQARQDEPARNEVILWGRLAAPAQERSLPSGDPIVTLRLVIPRRGGPPRPRRAAAPPARAAQVDTIDVVCWSAATRRAALRLAGGEVIEVEGALRRRFFGPAGGKQSRYEVEAGVLRKLSGRAASAS